MKTKIKKQSEVCSGCYESEGTLLKEFDEDVEKDYSWYEVSQMTPICASCGLIINEKETA